MKTYIIICAAIIFVLFAFWNFGHTYFKLNDGNTRYDTSDLVFAGFLMPVSFVLFIIAVVVLL